MRARFGIKIKIIQLTGKEAVELGIWVSDYPDITDVNLDFETNEVTIYDSHGMLVASRSFDYFK